MKYLSCIIIDQQYDRNHKNVFELQKLSHLCDIVFIYNESSFSKLIIRKFLSFFCESLKISVASMSHVLFDKDFLAIGTRNVSLMMEKK